VSASRTCIFARHLLLSIFIVAWERKGKRNRKIERFWISFSISRGRYLIQLEDKNWMDVSKFNEMLRTCRDFIRLEYECKMVVDLIEFQARESSFSEMRNESIILGLCFNRVQHTISMRFRSKQNANNFCEIMEIASENSREICAESTSIAWLYLQCNAFAYSLDRPIACNRGSTFKNDCRKSRLAKCTNTSGCEWRKEHVILMRSQKRTHACTHARTHIYDCDTLRFLLI